MSLSCSCGEWEGEGIGWDIPDNFTKLNTKRAKRCQSCNRLIKVGDECLEFTRFRATRDEIEYKIYGEDGIVYLASYYFCEECGEIYLNLENLGFCIDISEDNMQSLLEEYQEEYASEAWESFKK